MSNSILFCYSKEEPILTKKDTQIEKEQRKIKSKMLAGKLIKYETTRKTSGKCIYLKNGKCSLKVKPTLCEVFPVFFDVNLEDGSIIWLKYSKYKGRLTQKKLKNAKRKLKRFIETEKIERILLYIKFLKKYNLKVVEEEKISEKISKKLRRFRKKFREIHESKKTI